MKKIFTNEDGELFLDFITTAEVLGISRQRVSQLVRSGGIKVVEIDGKRYVPLLSIQEEKWGKELKSFFNKV